MNYQETIAYLYNSAPLFQHVGGKAYKEGLENTLSLDEHFNHPHQNFRTIHVAGTNGKGSCAHTIAAVLQAAGYKVGLYTSPHLVDFRERIKINGKEIPQDYVVDFVHNERSFFEPLHPSFFEITTALAFKYFADEQVDVAVIEVGLGGRLDCTNIITPMVSIITNISSDHTQFLGETLSQIAQEKAGIIKAGVPVVVGETTEETKPVFLEKALQEGAHIVFAEDEGEILSSSETDTWQREYITRTYGRIVGELFGDCQVKNTATILAALAIIRKELPFDEVAVLEGFKNVCSLTGLMGRWQILGNHPLTVCDTGHNEGGWQYLSKRLKSYQSGKLHIVFGMAEDKDVNAVLKLLPTQAHYYFTQASVKRAMSSEKLAEKAETFQLKGQCFASVPEAYLETQKNAASGDFIFIGGSCFVVADLLTALRDTQE